MLRFHCNVYRRWSVPLQRHQLPALLEELTQYIAAHLGIVADQVLAIEVTVSVPVGTRRPLATLSVRVTYNR